MKQYENCTRVLGFVDNAQSRKVKYPLSLDLFNGISSDAIVKNTISKVRATDDHEERQRLKRQLPAILFQGQHPDGKEGERKDALLVPTGFGIIDLDHCDPLQAYELFQQKCPMLQTYKRLVHKTPSDEGLRIVVELPEGMTIAQLQETVQEQMGIEVDKSTKNLGRLSYFPMKEEVLFLDERLFEPVEIRIPSTAAAPNPSAPTTAKACDAHYSTTYEGLPLANIWKRLYLLQKGEPIEGCRHERMKNAAPIMAYIYNYDAQWMTETAPNYGLSTAEVRGIMQWACQAEDRKNRIPKLLKQALSSARQTTMNDDIPPKYNWAQCKVPVIRLIAQKAPKQITASVVESLWPAFATHSNIDYTHFDGKERHVVIQNGNISVSNSGKSFCIDPEACILQPLKEADIPRMKKLDNWKNNKGNSGGRKKKGESNPARPTDVYQQVLSNNQTAASFTQVVADADRNGGKSQIVVVNELPLLCKLTGGRYNQEEFDTLLCCAFDCDEWSQNRVSPDGVTAGGRLHLNIRFSCVPNKAAKYLGGTSLTTGPLTRLNLVTTHTGIPYNGEDFIQGSYDQAFRDELQVYLDRLAQYTGHIDCPEALALAKKLRTEIWQRGDECDSEALKKIAARAAEIGYRKALLLYVMNDCQWNSSIASYITWAVNYDVWVKMHYFGSALEHAIREENNLSLGLNTNSLKCPLPNPFTRQQYLDWREGKDKNCGLLRQWIKRKKIRRDDNVEDLFWFIRA